MNDCDILHINNSIRDTLEKEIQTVPNLKETLNRYIWISNNGIQNDKTEAIKKINEIQETICDIESYAKLALYVLKTNNIIVEYRKKYVNTSFIKKKETNLNDKKVLIRKFIMTAREFAEFDKKFDTIVEKDCCEECGEKLIQMDNDEDGVCKNCGRENTICTSNASFKDVNRINLTKKYQYSPRCHFSIAIRAFQGIHKTSPQKINEIIKEIREQMKLHNLTVETVTKDHIYTFLKEMKNKSKNKNTKYMDLNYIHKEITGIPCPDISGLTHKLMEEFDIQEKALNIVCPDRVHSLNVNYKLMRLLNRNGYQCDINSFYILRTPSKKEEHDFIMNKAWDYLGWN